MKLRHFQENGWAIMLSAISQIQEDKYHVFSHIWSLDFKKHESRQGTIWEEEEEGDQQEGGQERVMGNESDQSTIYTYMKMS
jgi:hypothetical protein